MRAAALLCAVLATGCTSGGSGGRAAEHATPPAPSSPVHVSLSFPPSTEPPPCPHPASRPAWPPGVPSGFPWPGGRVTRVDRTKPDLLQVRLEAPLSLRESALFVVRRLPAAGFRLGRGDAEATELDAPFAKGEDLRGLVRVFVTAKPCTTLWAVVFARRGTPSPPPS
jgi:hypothetical protein